MLSLKHSPTPIVTTGETYSTKRMRKFVLDTFETCMRENAMRARCSGILITTDRLLQELFPDAWNDPVTLETISVMGASVAAAIDWRLVFNRCRPQIVPGGVLIRFAGLHRAEDVTRDVQSCLAGLPALCGKAWAWPVSREFSGVVVGPVDTRPKKIARGKRRYIL